MKEITEGNEYIYAESGMHCLVKVDKIEKFPASKDWGADGHAEYTVRQVGAKRSKYYPETWTVSVTLSEGHCMCPWHLLDPAIYS